MLLYQLNSKYLKNLKYKTLLLALITFLKKYLILKWINLKIRIKILLLKFKNLLSFNRNKILQKSKKIHHLIVYNKENQWIWILLNRTMMINNSRSLMVIPQFLCKIVWEPKAQILLNKLTNNHLKVKVNNNLNHLMVNKLIKIATNHHLFNLNKQN